MVSLRLFQLLGDGKLIVRAPMEKAAITCVSMSQHVCMIAYGCSNGLVRVFKPWEGCVVALGAHKAKVNHVLVIGGQEGRVFSAGKDGEVKIWKGCNSVTCSDNSGSGGSSHFSPLQEIRQLATPSGGALSQTVLTRCLNGSIRMWEVASGGLKAKFDFPSTDVTFSTCMDVCEVTR